MDQEWLLRETREIPEIFQIYSRDIPFPEKPSPKAKAAPGSLLAALEWRFQQDKGWIWDLNSPET